MQIWTEDSTTGYVYWKLINKYYFDNQFKVVACRGNRDLLFKLEKFNDNDLVIIILDSMIDNKLTEETYTKCSIEARKHKNVFIPLYGCTERSFLTFNNIIDLAPKVPKHILYQRNAILSSTDIYGIIPHNIRSKYSLDSERIYKQILASLTNNTNALISGGKIGICWVGNCCINSRFTCRHPSCMVIKDKLNYVIKNSEFWDTILDINEYLSAYLWRSYQRKLNERKYELEVQNHVRSEIELAKLASKMVYETGSYWNYERIYRRYFA